MSDDTQSPVISIDDEEATSWCEEEFGSIKLGDKRLDKRLIGTAAKLTAQPTAPVNQACEDWAATKASYRLFNNDKATVEKIREPHQQQTQERMKKYSLVLAVQDTTYLNYTGHPKTKGLGPIGTEEQNMSGLVMHPTLVLTPAGLPLGVLTQEIWARPEDAPKLTKTEKKNLPIEEKESYKWLKGLEKTVELTPEGVKVVSVCDRGADVFEFFVRADELETGILIRATQNRALVDDETGKLWAAAEAAPIAGHLKVDVPAKNNEPRREAIVSVRFCSVTLKLPWRPNLPDKDPLPAVTVYVVLTQEAILSGYAIA